MFTSMVATAFDLDAPLDQRRAIIRRDGDDVEMVELPWGLQPREPGGRPFTVIRAEGRTFPSHRCLVPASEFRHRSRGRQYTFSLANCDWFYFAGIWRPATRDWPESYAILTIEANADIAPYHDRQMAVLKRAGRGLKYSIPCAAVIGRRGFHIADIGDTRIGFLPLESEHR